MSAVRSPIAGLIGCSSEEAVVTLKVSAASSLADVVEEINGLCKEKHPNVTIMPTFDAFGILQTQIENGGACDVLISAGAEQVDALQTKGLLLDATCNNLLNNAIVVIVPNDSTLLHLPPEHLTIIDEQRLQSHEERCLCR